MSWQCFTTKTRLYNFVALKPHFYIVKLGFSGVYTFFLISAQKHRLWVLVRTASPRWFERVPTVYVLSRNMKNIVFFVRKFSVFFRRNFLYTFVIEQACFRNAFRHMKFQTVDSSKSVFLLYFLFVSSFRFRMLQFHVIKQISSWKNGVRDVDPSWVSSFHLFFLVIGRSFDDLQEIR